MSGARDTDDPAERMLAQLAELDLSLAQHVHACAVGQQDPEVVGKLAGAYQRIARSLRQTLALKARLERERRRGEREAREDAARVVQARMERRKARVRATLERDIWTEYEPRDAEMAIDALDDLLNEDALTDGFLAEPVEAYLERLRYDLSLVDVAEDPDRPPPRGVFRRHDRLGQIRRADIPGDFFAHMTSDAPPEPEPGDADWRSSA